MARVAITGMTKSSYSPGQFWLAPPTFTSSKAEPHKTRPVTSWSNKVVICSPPLCDLLELSIQSVNGAFQKALPVECFKNRRCNLTHSPYFDGGPLIVSFRPSHPANRIVNWLKLKIHWAYAYSGKSFWKDAKRLYLKRLLADSKRCSQSNSTVQEPSREPTTQHDQPRGYLPKL